MLERPPYELCSCVETQAPLDARPVRLDGPRRALAREVGADHLWSTNIGLAWMCFATLLPLGIAQLYKSVNDGYWEARDLNFLTEDTNALIEWLRLPGDIVFIAGGALPVLYITWIGIRHTVKRVTLEEPEDILFTQVSAPEGVVGVSGEEAASARVT